MGNADVFGLARLWVLNDGVRGVDDDSVHRQLGVNLVEPLVDLVLSERAGRWWKIAGSGYGW